LYNEANKEVKRYDSNFLIYSVGLSSSGKLLGFSVNGGSDIAIISLSLGNTYILKGHVNSLNRIYFIDDSTILSGNGDKKLILWRLKG
jgi:hypothetical protein